MYGCSLIVSCMHVHTGKSYVGQCKVDRFEVRFWQHSTEPEFHLRADVAYYQPFDSFFSMSVLYRVSDAKVADRMERAGIEQYNTLHPFGYNFLSGAPKRSKQWYAIMKAKGVKVGGAGRRRRTSAA